MAGWHKRRLAGFDEATLFRLTLALVCHGCGAAEVLVRMGGAFWFFGPCAKEATTGEMVGQDGFDKGLAALNEGTLKSLVLVRLACAGPKGLTRATLRGDLQPLVQHRLSGDEWRNRLDSLLLAILVEEHAKMIRARAAITQAGLDAVRRFLGVSINAGAEWKQVRDVHLVARALGLANEKLSRRKKLENADGLRAVILERSFGIKAPSDSSAATLRDALARKKSPRRRGAGPLAKRRAAEELLRRPREFDSDDALVAELAAEQVGAIQTSIPSLRKALLRRLLSNSVEVQTTRAITAALLGPATPSVEEPIVAASSSGSDSDIDTFAQVVRELSQQSADGWSGNRRAFICDVWAKLSDRHADWKLDEATFKSRLIEAHRAGLLTLAFADLRDKDNIASVQASAVRYQNTEWHFIRVDD